MRRLISGAAAALVLVGASQALAGADPAIERGRAIVQRNCAVCHAVGTRGASPNHEAPLFRELHTRYPVEMLAEALAEGILTGHPAMPQFEFPPRQIDDIIAYLRSIQTRGDAHLRGAPPPARHLGA